MKNIITRVSRNNPGALTVIRKLMYFPDWHKMMLCCLKNGLVGEQLFNVYKDVNNCNYYKTGIHIRELMHKEEIKLSKRLKTPNIKYSFKY